MPKLQIPEKPKSLRQQTKEIGVEMPPCDKCNSARYVRYLGPEVFGHELRCTKCRLQWCQPL